MLSALRACKPSSVYAGAVLSSTLLLSSCTAIVGLEPSVLEEAGADDSNAPASDTNGDSVVPPDTLHGDSSQPIDATSETLAPDAVDVTDLGDTKVDSETQDSAAFDSDAEDSTVVDTGTGDSAAVDSNSLDSSGTDSGAYDSTVVDTGKVDTGAPPDTGPPVGRWDQTSWDQCVFGP